MLGMFFFMALYIQNILGYSPLEAGVRFLPTTLVIMFLAPIAGRLTDRIGPRPLIFAGLAIVAVSLFMQAQIDLDSTYCDPARPLHPDGRRHRADDVADVDRGDERRRRDEGRPRLRACSRCRGWSAARSASPSSARSSRARATPLWRAPSPASAAPAAQIDAIGEQLGSGGLEQVIGALPADQAQQAADAAREAFINSLATSIGDLRGGRRRRRRAGAGAALAEAERESRAEADARPSSPRAPELAAH